MVQEPKYLVVKTKDKKEIVYMEYDKLTGYDITPKNQKTFADCIQVNKMILIQPSLIEKLVHKKVDRHFKRLLMLVTMLLEADDDTGTSLRECLNEVEKFRLEIKNKYREYLTKEELNLMAKKLMILNEEAKMRLSVLERTAKQEKVGKSR